jgi:DNA-binding XRE family transcriptional regulator
MAGMNHDLLHIQGKPYVLVPLHEYRVLSGGAGAGEELPAELADRIYARQEHPVRIVRQYRGMTQAALAAAAGLSRPYLTEIETGRKEGSVQAVKALAEALRVEAGLLLG